MLTLADLVMPVENPLVVATSVVENATFICVLCVDTFCRASLKTFHLNALCAERKWIGSWNCVFVLWNVCEVKKAFALEQFFLCS